jgi:hypothetical protein
MSDSKNPKERESLSLDEFLKSQKTVTFLATIEEVTEHRDLIKVTPWTPGAGCLCHAALEVPRDAIESVKPTDDTHYCCGQLLRVGEIRFKPGTKVDLEKVFAQVMQAVSRGGRPGGHLPFPMALEGT